MRASEKAGIQRRDFILEVLSRGAISRIVQAGVHPVGPLERLHFFQHLADLILDIFPDGERDVHDLEINSFADAPTRPIDSPRD